MQGYSSYKHRDWIYITPPLLLPMMSYRQQTASDLELPQGLCMTVVMIDIEASSPPSYRCFVLLNDCSSSSELLQELWTERRFTVSCRCLALDNNFKFSIIWSVYFQVLSSVSKKIQDLPPLPPLWRANKTACLATLMSGTPP